MNRTTNKNMHLTTIREAPSVALELMKQGTVSTWEPYE